MHIDGDQLEEAEAKLLGDILKAYDIEFSDSGVNIQQLCDGQSGLTYEEMQFLMKDNQATKNISMNLKQKLKSSKNCFTLNPCKPDFCASNNEDAQIQK